MESWTLILGPFGFRFFFITFRFRAKESSSGSLLRVFFSFRVSCCVMSTSCCFRLLRDIQCGTSDYETAEVWDPPLLPPRGNWIVGHILLSFHLVMSVQAKVPGKEKDNTTGNVVTLGIGMSLCLLGVKVSSSFIVPILGNLGSICQSALYFANSFANFFVPPILNFFKNERRTMFLTSFEYGLYILNFAYIIPPVAVVWSFIHGIFAAVLWTAEGIYLCANSNDQDRGKKSGLFWTLYMTGAALGNIGVYLLLKFIGIGNYPSPSGWHDSASVMFIFLGVISLLGAIPMFLLKPSPGESSRKFVAKTSPKVLMKKMCRLMVSPNMRWLLFPMFFVGFEYVFIGSMLTRQVHKTGDVGLMMSLFCIVEMIVSTPLGVLLDKLGNVAMFTLASVFELLALLFFWIGNKQQNLVFYVAFVFLSLSDSTYETIVPTILGRNYSDLESANSCYRLYQYMGSCICYLIAPLFVDQDTKWVSDASLLREITMCVVMCVVSLVLFIVYDRTFRREIPVKVAPAPADQKTVELHHVANEDLEDVSKDGAKKPAEPEPEPKEKVAIDIKTNFNSNEDFVH